MKKMCLPLKVYVFLNKIVITQYNAPKFNFVRIN